MKYYKEYMDRQKMSELGHQRLLHLKVEKKPVQWQKWAGLAACCALILGIGTFAVSRMGHKEPPVVANTDPVEGGQEDFWSQSPGGLMSTDDRGEVTVTVGEGDRAGFVADSGEDQGKLMFPMVPAIHYTDGEEEPRASIALPDGAFAKALSQRDIELLLWGSEERLNAAHAKEKPGNVPWMLFWDGFTLSGEAMYDGNGDLWQATLWGDRGDEEFTIRMAPGKLPPTCWVSPAQEKTDVRGVEVQAWKNFYDSNGDEVKEYHYDSAFIANGVGVRASFVIPETAEVSTLDGVAQWPRLSDLFINWCIYEGDGLTLEHISHRDDIPAWAEEKLESLAEALEYGDFAPYLPKTAPVSGEFNGHYSYQEGVTNTLWVHWYHGYDTVEVQVRLPGDSYITQCEPVDITKPETYDCRLYEIPWCDSVPQEYMEYFLGTTTFRAADMSLETVRAKEVPHDTGGVSYDFNVLLDNGVLVTYRCDGMTAEEVWALVEPITK